MSTTAPEMTFYQCLMVCANTPELVEQYNRLCNSALGNDARTPIERAIDEATGYQEALNKQQAVELVGFVAFVYEVVYAPVFGEIAP